MSIDNEKGAAPPPPEASAASPRKETTVNTVVFGASLTITLVVAVWLMIWPSQAESTIGSLVGYTGTWFGWFYIALATLVLVFVLFLAISRYGSVKLGPDHSKPEFSTFSWAAMLFAAGIGTDLMFFSVAEPVTQYLAPPVGSGETVEAAREATVWTLFHYGITGWGMYALMGMALGYFAYRRNLPLAVRSALYPLFGRRIDGALGHTVDTAAVLGTIFGVATSLGIGVVQLNFGLNLIFGLPEGTAAQVGLIALAVVIATISATTGVDKGIRLLSQINVLLAIGLAAWILVAGQTAFLLNAIVMNVGDFVTSFPGLTMQTFAFNDTAEWMSFWTLFFWAWWIAWASFVGLFLARISRGRTIRQFVAGTMIIPFSYVVMWVSIFGNSALARVRGGDDAFGELAMNQPERGFYTLLQDYPGALFIIGVATLVGLLFYVTSADSGALVMANLSSTLKTSHADADAWLRIVWAVGTGVLTSALLIAGGITALQYATVIMGLPFAFVMVLVMVGLYRALRIEAYRVDSGQHVLPTMLSARDSSIVNESDELPPRHVWRGRLSHALTFPDVDKGSRFLDDTVTPALEEVAEELSSQGVEASVSVDTVAEAERDLPEGNDVARRNVHLQTSLDSPHPFVYRVELHDAPVPAYAGRMPRGEERYARLEVHTVEGGQGYDVMGYTQSQIIHDCLDAYLRHLEFLRLEASAESE
ncbi:MAG TPA: choline BCCT transporter BetT [Ornithinimicrobium sp.]|uniref:choline BCCT transporter BetT n=1 Tax=Ornithinimicrobium sp. TaxID=1977084 RepID=UPI002B468773|nr:choline BCCT transporter BetT [Ornithinimicrobium sp.]HKJ12124.1 choline BCCT transporter BetT [Ornithinimicrobium sp.]